jgi:hypothetical protein
VSSRPILIGDEVRVSTPVITASAMAKPLIWRSKLAIADRRDREFRQAGGEIAHAHAGLIGRDHVAAVEGLMARKSPTSCAGAA